MMDTRGRVCVRPPTTLQNSLLTSTLNPPPPPSTSPIHQNPCNDACVVNDDCGYDQFGEERACMHNPKNTESTYLRRRLFGDVKCPTGECWDIPRCLQDCSAFQAGVASGAAFDDRFGEDRDFTCAMFDDVKQCFSPGASCDGVEPQMFNLQNKLMCDFEGGKCGMFDEVTDIQSDDVLCTNTECRETFGTFLELMGSGEGGAMELFIYDTSIDYRCNSCGVSFEHDFQDFVEGLKKQCQVRGTECDFLEGIWHHIYQPHMCPQLPATCTWGVDEFAESPYGCNTGDVGA